MAERIYPQQQSPPPSDAIPSVPDHELIRLIGRGSYGEVWLAKSTLGAYRAVKIVREAAFRQRRPFEREFHGVKTFEPVSRLHDGLMDVLQVGRNDAEGYFYCVMELADDVRTGQEIISGDYRPRTLADDLVRQKRLPVRECRRIAVTIASALHFLHQRRLIHRDVKPSNIVFVNGVPKLADIGLVAEISEARSYVGTEGFIPPEGPGTVQADVYSLGKVLYEISTGKDRHEYPELPTESGDSALDEGLPGLNRIILKACRMDPGQRYRSAAAMEADLRLLDSGRKGREAERWLRTRRRVAGLVLIAGMICALWFLGNQKPKTRPRAGAGVARSVDDESLEPTTLRTGLVGYWPGEDGAVDNGRSNDGQLVGGVTLAPGKVGQAFCFATSDAVVKVEAFPELDLGTCRGFTLSAWINPTRTDVRGSIFEWNDGNSVWGVHFDIDPFWALGDVRPGAIAANLVDTEFNWHRLSSDAGVLVNNTFQHVALTYNKDTGEAVIYCNGTIVARRTFGSFTGLTSHDLYIGRRVSAEVAHDTFGYSGMIDEPAVHNRALAPEEIRSLYEAGQASAQPLQPMATPVPEGLVAWWRGEDVATDIGSGLNGTPKAGVEYAAGKVGRAFSFSGAIDSLIEIPDSDPLHLTNELTIEFWVLRKKPFGPDVLINKGGDWTRKTLNFSVCIGLPRYKNALFFSFPGQSRSAGIIADTRWHHCAVTVRRGEIDPIFYIDGVQVPTVPVDNPLPITLFPSTEPLRLGAQVEVPDGYCYYSKAILDELSIYRRVLRPAEIRAIYQAGRAGKAVVLPHAGAL